MEVQLKCTETVEDRSGKSFPFFLKKKNYNDLCGGLSLVPRVLVVLCVPKALTDWLKNGADFLEMHHRAYWHSLAAVGETENETGETVHVSTTNVFDVVALTALMATVAGGKHP